MAIETNANTESTGQTDAGQTPVEVDDAYAREQDAIALVRELRAKAEAEDTAAEQPTAEQQAAETPAEGVKPDAEKTADEEAKPDPLEEVEKRARARAAAARQQREAEAKAKTDHETAVSKAREEGRAEARAAYEQRVRADIIGFFEDIGIDPAQAFGILREQAANPQRRRPTEAKPLDPDDIAERVHKRIAGDKQSATERDEAERRAEHEEARMIFAELTADEASYPILSDHTAEQRAEIGTLVARELVRANKPCGFVDIAKEAERLLQDQARKRAQKLGLRESTTSDTKEPPDAERGRGNGAANTPRTLTADLASEHSNKPKQHPDGIAPEDERLEDAINFAKKLKREAEQREAAG